MGIAVPLDQPPGNVGHDGVSSPFGDAMLANQRSYEQGLEDLKQAVFAEIDIIKHSVPKVPVGELLEEIDIRNTDGALINVQGINIEKQFMPSVADTTSVNLKNYKVVRNGQFAYSSMQTGRDECIRIALYDKGKPILISPAYSVLQVKGSSAVAEYIMLWFSRPETDRYGWFASDASVRANLDLDRFYEIQIPLLNCLLRRQSFCTKVTSAVLSPVPIWLKPSVTGQVVVCISPPSRSFVKKQACSLTVVISSVFLMRLTEHRLVWAQN